MDLWVEVRSDLVYTASPITFWLSLVKLRRSLTAFQHFILGVRALFLHRWVSLFYLLRFNWLYVARFVLLAWAQHCWVTYPFGPMRLVSLITRGLYEVCKLMSCHWIFGWGHHWLSRLFMLACYEVGGIVDSAHWWLLFISCLLLAFVPRFFPGRNLSLLRSFDCLLDSGWKFRGASLSISRWTTHFIVEAQDLPHTFFELWLADSVPTHRNELIWPQLLQLTNLPGSHNNGASNCNLVKLEKHSFLETKSCENFTIVLHHSDSFQVGLHHSRHSVWSEDNTLAHKVTQDVVNRNEVDLPVKSLKQVLLLS